MGMRFNSAEVVSASSAKAEALLSDYMEWFYASYVKTNTSILELKKRLLASDLDEGADSFVVKFDGDLTMEMKSSSLRNW